MADQQETRADQLARRRTAMAAERTLMAATRTLMAWVRTGIAQISFGFTAYKILEGFQAEGKLNTQHTFITAGKAGATLLCLGIVAIAFGIVEYRAVYREHGMKPRMGPVWMAGLVLLVGLGMLMAIFLHL